MFDSRQTVLTIFDAYSPPDMRLCRSYLQLAIQQVTLALRTFCENLICMPIRLTHYTRYGSDVSGRNELVEKVAHRVDKDHFRSRPAEWFA